MRPRKTETRNLPPRMYQWTRIRKSGKVWVAYYYLDMTGKAIPLGKDLDLARIKWADLEAKEKPLDLRTMKGIFDRYIRDIVSKKAARTQKDNLAEIKQLRPMFDSAPIDSITPATIAGYRDARTAKVRANREIATLSHVFNIAREWGLTTKENPCQGVRKNKETPRDYYANDVVWDAVYVKAAQELKDAMDLAYLTGHLMYEKALIIQGFVVSGVQEFCSSLYGSFPHLFGHFRNPALLPPLRPPSAAR